MELTYNQRYDATAAKGLCWECKANPVATSEIVLNKIVERVESLWCLDCQIKFGWVEESAEVN